MLKEKPFNKGPFARDRSHYFFEVIKCGDFLEVRNCLALDPLLVLDYDNIGMTGLHWAVKKGFEMIVDLLVENHADADASDMLNRTPSYFAHHCNNKYIKSTIYMAIDQMKRFRRFNRLQVDKSQKPEAVHVPTSISQGNSPKESSKKSDKIGK